MFEPKEVKPTPVLLTAVVLASKAKAPTATFECPVVFDNKA